MPRRSNSNERSYNLHEIEALAARQLEEFRARLTRNGFELPPMPPVPVEFMAETVTEFRVQAVRNLRVADRKLAGLLDPGNQEILYEETDLPGRQNFSIAHEIGHYFLHYLPAKQQAELPSLFSQEELAAVTTDEKLQFFRCEESELDIQSQDDTPEADPHDEPANTSPLRTALEDPARQVRLAKILRFESHRKRHEWQANTFASALLMPPDLVRWLKTKHGGDLSRMAAELNVSQQALYYRLERLKELGDISQANPTRFAKKPQNSPSQQGTFF